MYIVHNLLLNLMSYVTSMNSISTYFIVINKDIAPHNAITPCFLHQRVWIPYYMVPARRIAYSSRVPPAHRTVTVGAVTGLMEWHSLPSASVGAREHHHHPSPPLSSSPPSETQPAARPGALPRRAFTPPRFVSGESWEGRGDSRQVTGRVPHGDEERRAAGPSQTIVPRYGGDNVIGCYRRGGVNQLAAGGAAAGEWGRKSDVRCPAVACGRENRSFLRRNVNAELRQSFVAELRSCGVGVVGCQARKLSSCLVTWSNADQFDVWDTRALVFKDNKPRVIWTIK